MLNCNPSPMHINMNENSVLDNGTGATNASHYRSLVCGLNYLSHTRPDITFSVSLISRFMHSPLKQHLGASKRILRYVPGTTSHRIWYSKVSGFFRLVRFTNSDWAGSLDDHNSTSGNSFSHVSGAVSRSSKKKIQQLCYLWKQNIWLQLHHVVKLFC